MSLHNIIVSARRVTLFPQPSDTQPQAVLEHRECLGVPVVSGSSFFFFLTLPDGAFCA